MDIKVNHLPVLTWNQLKLNDTTITIEEIPIGTPNVYRSPVDLPDGVTLEQNVNSQDLQDRFDALGISNPPEKVIAGKVPMYNTQKFATGMGGAIDEWMKQKDVTAEVFTVESNFRSEEPLLFQYAIPAGSSTLERTLIHAKEGSESTFILYYMADKDAAEGEPNAGKTAADEAHDIRKTATDKSGTINGVQTYIYLEKNAKVHLHVVQTLAPKTTFFHDIGSFSQDKSEFTLTKLDLGALTVYEGLNETQMGDKSVFSSDLGYVGIAGSKMDINYNDVFWGKKAEGRMYFKEALLDDAKKTFRGTVDFRQDSVGSVGDEQEDIILLGDDIVNKTIPLILCEEEDVEGRHASTIGSLSEEMLFYMQTRGIDPQKAAELMVTANINSISKKIPSEEIRTATDKFICRIFNPSCHNC